jgi:ribosomal protein S18 acetylase RimI-like enzyme
MSHIRAARRDDIEALYDICLKTADAGSDATDLYEDPQLVGNIFAAPYLLFEPSLAFVVEDGSGVGGYVLGALDSRAFGEVLDREWWPELRKRYPESTVVPGSQDHEMIRYIHRPPAVAEEVYRDFPSHLHIDLLPRMQGRGLGGAILHTLLDALRANGSPGVHLHVLAQNERAVGFYRHLGFTEIGRSPTGFTLGMSLVGTGRDGRGGRG